MQKGWFVWIFILLAVFTRVYFYFIVSPFYPVGTKIRVTGKVVSEPVRYSSSQYIKLSGFRFYLPLYPEVNYGDEIVVEGEVEGDKLKKAELVKVKEAEAFFYKLRKNLVVFYQKYLPQPYSSLVAGVTLGSKANIPGDFWEALKISGTAHVVVASGMNVTLVAGFLMSGLVSVFPRRKAIPLALAGIWFYSFISGFDAPIIRAAIMGSIAFTAQQLGKIYFAFRTLVISALLMIFFKPEWLLDLGFILSFVATLSLMLFEARIYRRLRFIPGPEMLSRDLSTTLAAQVGVAPILLFTFGQFNILSPIINAAVLWTIPPITIIGMVAGMLSLIYVPLGRAVLLLTYPLAGWFVLVVNFFGNISIF